MTIKYDNCKNCRSRCIHAGKDRDFVCINGVSCKITTGKSQTNADRIRAMSDEELAKAIASKAYTGACNDFDISYDGNCCHNCEKCDAIIKWLQQPAE